MTLDELRALCRSLADDTVAPYLWSDAEWDQFLNEAEREACIRARLIEDDSTAAVTRVVITTARRRYPLHPSIIDVLCIEADSQPGRPITAAWEADGAELVFADLPLAADTLTLTVKRLPLKEMNSDEKSPEIQAHHHFRLIDWALRCAYLKQDAETLDEAKAAKYEAMFVQSFGFRPSASVLRKQRRRSAPVVRHNPF